MDVFLAGLDSLKLTRIARRDPGLELVPAGSAHMDADSSPVDLAALRLALPREMGAFSPGKPIALTFFSREGRCCDRRVSPRALLASLPPDTFLEVVRSDGSPWPYAGEGSLHLYVESAGLGLVRTEQLLAGLVGRGSLTRRAAFLRLLTFPMEACGLYARDPEDPAGGPCAFEVEPIARPEDIVALLDELRGIRGLRRARLAATYVQSGSGSPEETLLSFAFKLPARLGGIEAPPFVENAPIAWPDQVRGLVEHHRMRPDFHWPDHLTAAEYNGRTHMSQRGFEEDQRRIRDYQSCGISVFPASYRDVSTPHALDGYLARIAHSLARFEGAEFETRVRRALADEGAAHARRVLLGQMLPAVPSEKGQ